jgi:predicted lysophospholipase L1 biosynthesis ABC-type transport system permease subunit
MYGADIGETLAMALAVVISPIPMVGLVLVLAMPQAGFGAALGSMLGLVAAGTIALMATAKVDPTVSEEPTSGIGWPMVVALGALLVLLVLRRWA